MTKFKADPKSFLDDAAGMIGGAAGLLSEMRNQISGDMNARVKSFADKADLANISDIERLEAMMLDISARLEKVEAQLAAPKKGGKAKAGKTKANKNSEDA